jgi:hypothetical protein
MRVEYYNCKGAAFILQQNMGNVIYFFGSYCRFQLSPDAAASMVALWKIKYK